MSEKKEDTIKFVKNLLGSDYDRVKWIDDKSALKYAVLRDDYYSFFKKNNVRFPEGNLSKPFLNSLSPGCVCCINGKWSCIFTNILCTRKCFFCPQFRNNKSEKKPEEFPFIFNSPDDYMFYLSKFDFEGISFTGGEPLLVIDRVKEYMEKIAQKYGKKHYIWLYTNGDLVNDEKMKLLSLLGIDEIRFDLSANDYNLEPLKIALKHIKTVTVEIPAIPEDIEKVIGLIKTLEEIGVKHLNIHQLMMSKANIDSFAKRGYTILHTHSLSNFPVLESEFAAYMILDHAIKIGSKLGINYCSTCYKDRFQQKGARKRFAKYCMTGRDSLTKSGYVRRLYLVSDDKNISNITIDADQLSSYLGKGKKILVKYLNPSCFSERAILHDSRFISEEKWQNFFKPYEEFTSELADNTAIFFFNNLFIKGTKLMRFEEELLSSFELTKQEQMTIRKNVLDFYLQFKDFEYIDSKLPDYL